MVPGTLNSTLQTDMLSRRKFSAMKFMEQEKRQNLLNSHIESKEIKAIRRIMDQSSSLQPYFTHLRISFIGHSWVVIIRYFCIKTSLVHAHPHSLRDDDASKFSLFAILSLYIHLLCIYLLYYLFWYSSVFRSSKIDERKWYKKSSST